MCAGRVPGIDAGEFVSIPGFPTVTDAVLNDLNAAGIRVRMRAMERATFYAAWQEKKLRGLFMTDCDWLSFGDGQDKSRLYSGLLRSMMEDQAAWIRDRNHRRIMTEANGRDSLAMACTADALAHREVGV